MTNTGKIGRAPFPPRSSQHIVEALGFLKDWTTSVIQIETAALTAIGAIFFTKDAPRDVGILQSVFLLLAALTFGLSMVYGVFLLNTLPGAAQRQPAPNDDVYSIINTGKWSVGNYASWFRGLFILGLVFIVCFIVARIADAELQRMTPGGIPPNPSTQSPQAR